MISLKMYNLRVSHFTGSKTGNVSITQHRGAFA